MDICRYSRCEAQNPRFTARYGTLLEAYLVGCGKGMLVCIIHYMTYYYNLPD